MGGNPTGFQKCVIQESTSGMQTMSQVLDPFLPEVAMKFNNYAFPKTTFFDLD